MLFKIWKILTILGDLGTDIFQDKRPLVAVCDAAR